MLEKISLSINLGFFVIFLFVLSARLVSTFVNQVPIFKDDGSNSNSIPIGHGFDGAGLIRKGVHGEKRDRSQGLAWFVLSFTDKGLFVHGSDQLNSHVLATFATIPTPFLAFLRRDVSGSLAILSWTWMNPLFQDLVSMMTQTNVSLDRISGFLQDVELQEEDVTIVLPRCLTNVSIIQVKDCEFLPSVDLILVLKDEAGKYEILLQAGTDFKTLVSAHHKAIEAMDIPSCKSENSVEKVPLDGSIMLRKRCDSTVSIIASLVKEVPENKSTWGLKAIMEKKKLKCSRKKHLVQEAMDDVFAGENTLVSYIGRYLVSYFVDYLGGNATYANEGYVLASILPDRPWYLGVDILGMHVRSALTAMVDRKGLKLSSSVRQSHTSREIVNYNAVDVQRVGDYSWYLHEIWMLPMQIVPALLIQYKNVGIAVVATVPLAKMQEDYQDKLMITKDKRMRKTSERLSNMRILKLQAWEDRYQVTLEDIQQDEFKWLQKALYAQIFITFIFWDSPIFVSVITFGTCLLLGGQLTVRSVLSALATFKILEEPLRNFPDLVSMMAQTKVSLDCILGFLEDEELLEDATIVIPRALINVSIAIKDGKFSWDSPSPRPKVSELQMKVERGMHVAVCGMVGAGKSSFLSCILGGIPKISGEVKKCGSAAYVSQSAWIQYGTMEEIILYGSQMDKAKYRNVVHACTLKKDLKLFYHGDGIIMDDRGINLSGGQKQRVQLAWPLRQDVDIYLLDDPFSAVGTHTGSELFSEYISTALATKTITFIIHQVEFLPSADLILIPLELRDSLLLAPKERSKTCYKVLNLNWKKCKAKNPSKQPSLAWAVIFKPFWKEATMNAVFAGVNTLVSYVGSYLVCYFVDYLGDNATYANEGYVLDSIFSAAKLVEIMTTRQWYLGVDILGMHVRSALMAMVYRKGLKLLSSVRQSHASHEIVNYMAVDMQRVCDYSWYLLDIWILPMKIVLALAILYKNLGIATVATLIVKIVSIVVTVPLRMRKTSECLSNMRILKLQAWEDRYRVMLEDIWQVEFKSLQKALYSQAFITFIFWGSPIFVSLITFGTCILLGGQLTAGSILSALATFMILQEPNRNFPDLVSMMAQMKVSLDRILGFLEDEELLEDTTIVIPRALINVSIAIKDGKFSWDSPSPRPRLSGIQMKVERGMRVAVCGMVGAGKLSFLSCILGEIPKLSGEVKIFGSAAYVSQSAWIQSGTIEEDIPYGNQMDKAKYRNVVHECTLKKDLKLFYHGDEIIMGDRGINLSGGQKQRVQLAWPLYHDVDIYLLDDPFSAIDTHTGSELFSEYILAALATKTVIFIIHQVEFLPSADLILIPLELRDIPLLAQKKRSKTSYKVLNSNWKKCQAKNPSKQPSLAWAAIFKPFWKEAAMNAVFAGVSVDQSVVDLDIPFRLGGFASTTIKLWYSCHGEGSYMTNLAAACLNGHCLLVDAGFIHTKDEDNWLTMEWGCAIHGQ